MQSSFASQPKRNKFCDCLSIFRRAFQPRTNLDSNLQKAMKLSKKGSTEISGTNGQTFYNTQADTTSGIFMNKAGATQSNQIENKAETVQNVPMMIQEDSQRSNYIFKFIQRQEYFQKKLAPQQNVLTNAQIVNNFKVYSTVLSHEVKYCESINGNLFLLKYFKFECGLCSRLCSHILISDCCKAPICFDCVADLIQHFKVNGRIHNCLFCNKGCDPVRLYLIRDPMLFEQKELAMNCKNKQILQLSSAPRSNGESDQTVIQHSPNRDESMIKPTRLDFQADHLKILDTDSSIKNRLRSSIFSSGSVYVDSAQKHSNSKANDMTPNMQQESPLKWGKQEKTMIPLSQVRLNNAGYNNTQYSSNLSHNQIQIEIANNSILQESIPQQPIHQQLAGRKRVNHKMKLSAKKMSSANTSIQGSFEWDQKKATKKKSSKGGKHINNENLDPNSQKTSVSDLEHGQIRRSSRQIKK